MIRASSTYVHGVRREYIGREEQQGPEEGVEGCLQRYTSRSGGCGCPDGGWFWILTRFRKVFPLAVPELSSHISGDSDLAVGMLFMPHTTEHSFAACKSIVESVIQKRELRFLGWRIVPTDSSHLGDKAAATQPNIRQVLIGKPKHLSADEFERTLYITRREIEREMKNASIDNFYAASFSSRTIVYKGLVTPLTLDRFYLDLQLPEDQTALAIFHQRFSTNTFPRWELAHPFRMLGHNGEDQHDSRKQKLDKGTRSRIGITLLERRRRIPETHSSAECERLGKCRQRSRSINAFRTRDPSFNADACSRGMDSI